MNYNTLKYIAFLALGTSLVVSCDPEFEKELDSRAPASSGKADFSKYVALGNSLTAGFADNSLYIDGQLAGYPNILAEQMKFAGGGEFTIPLATSNAGGLTIGGQEIPSACSGTNSFPKRSVLAIIDGERGVKPFGGSGAPTEATTVLTGPFNNMGVPGAKSFHLLAPGYGSAANLADGLANPYFVRMASSPDNTIVADAVAQDPTFFTLWIGNNDALGYATAGGVTKADNATCGDDLTDPAMFPTFYGGIVQTLLSSTNAKGVLINLPSITSIPFFTTVPYNPIPMDAATATGTNAAYAPYNGGLQQLAAGGAITAEELAARTINFKAGQNAVVILDESLTDLTGSDPNLLNLRQATPNDLLVLTSSGVIGTEAIKGDPRTTIGVAIPLEDKWVLTPAEQQEIADAQIAYNATITSLVAANPDRLALYDAKSALDEVASTGITVDGGIVTAEFASGGGFSLDGVHLTPRGNAVIANGLIDVINENFESNLTPVQPGTYKTITVE